MKELIEEIVNHCDGIIERSERMTSGNYMHNCLANRFSANTIKTCMGLLSKSVINWQTGEPTEHGHYLITLRYCYGVNVSTGKKYYAETVTKSTWKGFWYNFRDVERYKVLAWCKLSDVEPYKELVKEE